MAAASNGHGPFSFWRSIFLDSFCVVFYHKMLQQDISGTRYTEVAEIGLVLMFMCFRGMSGVAKEEISPGNVLTSIDMPEDCFLTSCYSGVFSVG